MTTTRHTTEQLLNAAALYEANAAYWDQQPGRTAQVNAAFQRSLAEGLRARVQA